MHAAGGPFDAVVLDLTFADTFMHVGPMTRAEALLWIDRFGRGLPYEGRYVREALIIYLGPPGLLVRGPTQ